ncbi:cast multi-domain protein [Stylonychia lemnae]|uniref:Cast multi-domain protein n=1 Tax=Stylonychia lemnae TaxID=5949 RepID=A0A077ZPK8_STYLE|nr:cast multi-domain protein [Stylonychia lemnae]|eukprot:CDW71823.1 cast multi-domain protein [Stylonychia lemnae]
MNRQRIKEMSLLLFSIVLLKQAQSASTCSSGEYHDGTQCLPCTPAGKIYQKQQFQDMLVLLQARFQLFVCQELILPRVQQHACPVLLDTIAQEEETLIKLNAIMDITLHQELGKDYILRLSSYCEPCPRGYMCTTKSKEKCPTGSYNYGKNPGCTSCSAGMFCHESLNERITCPIGYYSLLEAMQLYCISNDYSDCTRCPAGSKCPTKNASPISCDDGQYSTSGSTTCNDCPKGFSCPTKISLPQACPAGTYSDGKQTSCTQCPGGYECSLTTDSNQIKECQPGFYALPGSSTCLACPAGYECINKGQSPTQCPPGFYRLASSTSGCIQSPAGKALKSQKQEPLDCPKGYYSNPGDASCTLCPAGSYCPDTATKVSCSTTGTNCLAGSTAQEVCPSKYGCSSISSIPIICQSGYYADESTKQCVICPAGFDCSISSTKTLAQNGFYSPSGSIQSFVCPAGYKCVFSDLTGAFEKTHCSDGQYSDEGSGICTDCEQGFACPSKESSQMRIDCSKFKGLYGETTKLQKCSVCPSGYYCPYGSSLKIQCDSGYFSQQGADKCFQCPPGYECPNRDQNSIAPCKLGTFSTGAKQHCDICPAGYSCSSEQMFKCPAYQTSEAGDGFCSYFIAPVKSASITNNIVTYLQCDDGQFKLFGTLGCIDCPKGHYCPNKGIAPVKCQPGTFQDQEKQTECKICPTLDNEETKQFYSSFGEYQCHICPAGHYCTNSTSMPKQCQLGFYSKKGSTECTYCSDGYVCRFKEQEAEPMYSLCPAGFYCKADLANDGRLLQRACPAGSYQPYRGKTSSEDCLSCPKGYYCPAGSETPRNCTPGSYCIDQTEHNQVYQCSNGKYGTVFMGTSENVCNACPEGYFCPKGSVQPVKCPTGFFCQENQESGMANPCPSGTYSGPFSLTSRDQCQTCPTGYYCPTASTLPKACPTGTYNPSTGQGSISDCLSCPERRPCPFYGLSTFDLGLYCAHGHYCPAKTSFPNQFPCPAGKYSDDINITSSSQCLICPEKFACYEGTNTLTRPKVPCAPGYYCPSGTEKPTQYLNQLLIYPETKRVQERD